ncbi:MAG: hypothetical protein B1H04_02065 [Planctomycetales bacterium 4484_123]|nr:MAG: hypothetical protein B1H04_02065 [Planctomycetales bacterium 4484_123]
MAPPNLLLLFTDEQRYDTLGAYGNEGIKTPNLDRLAARSNVFQRAYVTQPVCTPSRSTLLTGLYPHATGCVANNVPLPPDVPCLPEMLPPGLYATAYHGKWHLGDEVFAQHGFDEWVSMEDMYIPYYRPGRDRSARSDYHHVLFVNFLEPHMPFFGPRDGQHDPDEVALPDNFQTESPQAEPLKARLLREFYRQVGHSDLLPTLLELMGQGQPGHLQGSSLRPQLEGTGADTRDVFIEWNGTDSGLEQFTAGRDYPAYLARLASAEQCAAAGQSHRDRREERAEHVTG